MIYIIFVIHGIKIKISMKYFDCIFYKTSGLVTAILLLLTVVRLLSMLN